MKGLFVNGAVVENQGPTDFGYYVDNGIYSGSVEDLQDLAAQDKAYIVEVFEKSDAYHIKLHSENRQTKAKTDGKIEKKHKGTTESIHQTTKEPIMPKTYEDPDKAIEAYAEYALKHQEQAEGIELDIEMDKFLDEENQDY